MIADNIVTSRPDSDNGSFDPNAGCPTPNMPDLPKPGPSNDQEPEYKIKRFCGIGFDENKEVMLRVEWDGYPDKVDWTWEHEKDLIYFYDMVKAYRSKFERRLPRISLRPLGGASLERDDVDHNLDIWVDLDRIRSVAKHYLDLYSLAEDLNLIVCHIGDFVNKPRKDSLIILLHECHYYSLLWLPRRKKFFISDGMDLCMTEPTLEELKRLLKVELTPITVAKRLKVDHCAAASVLCCMEYARINKKEDLKFSAIIFAKSLHDRIVQVLHPEKSASEPGRNDITKVERALTCEKCHSFKTTRGKVALSNHQRSGKCVPSI